MIVLRETEAGYEILTDRDVEELTGAQINAAVRALVAAGECCSICDPECEAPVGRHRTTSTGHAVFDDGLVVAEYRCSECSQPVCAACSEEHRWPTCCRNCQEDQS